MTGEQLPEGYRAPELSTTSAETVPTLASEVEKLTDEIRTASTQVQQLIDLRARVLNDSARLAAVDGVIGQRVARVAENARLIAEKNRELLDAITKIKSKQLRESSLPPNTLSEADAISGVALRGDFGADAFQEGGQKTPHQPINFEKLTSMEKDPLFFDAVGAILNRGRASAVVIQRQCGVPYSRGIRILDQMTEAGLLGPDSLTGSREIYVTKEEWEKFLP